MNKRQWGAKTTAMIVREGHQGKSVAEICPAPQLRQSLDDQWRDQLLAHAAKVFDDPQRTRKAARLEPEHARLTPLVGEGTWEFKQSDERLA